MRKSKFHQILFCASVLISSFSISAAQAGIYDAPEKVHYSVEVYRGAEKVISAGMEASMNQNAPISLVADSIDAHGGVHKNGFMMNLKPFYINDQLMTAFDFNATDMASTSGYKNILKSNCGEIVHVPIWSSNTQNQYMVKITPYIL